MWKSLRFPHIRQFSSSRSILLDLSSKNAVLKLYDEKRCVLLTNLEIYFDEGYLRARFERYGPVEDIIYQRPRKDPYAKTCPKFEHDDHIHIIFQKSEAALKVVEQAKLAPLLLYNTPAGVHLLTREGAYGLQRNYLKTTADYKTIPHSKRLWLSPVPPLVGHEDVHREFSKYGTILSVHLIPHRTLRYRCSFALILYADRPLIDGALLRPEGGRRMYRFPGVNAPMSVRYSDDGAYGAASVLCLRMFFIQPEPWMGKRWPLLVARSRTVLDDFLNENEMKEKMVKDPFIIKTSSPDNVKYYFPYIEWLVEFKDDDSASKAKKLSDQHFDTLEGVHTEVLYWYNDRSTRLLEEKEEKNEIFGVKSLKVPGRKQW